MGKVIFIISAVSALCLVLLAMGACVDSKKSSKKGFEEAMKYSNPETEEEE